MESSMEGSDKAQIINELHDECSKEQERHWIEYWAAIIYDDNGLAELYKLKEGIANLYKQYYYREEREDAKHDDMETFSHEGEDEDE